MVWLGSSANRFHLHGQLQSEIGSV
jgi:hypothetical protein